MALLSPSGLADLKKTPEQAFTIPLPKRAMPDYRRCFSESPQFLIKSVSRKYSNIWFRFTSEIKVEKKTIAMKFFSKKGVYYALLTKLATFSTFTSKIFD